MRTITIPDKALQMAADPNVPGAYIECAVTVDWPELRLTEEQSLANALARAYGHEPPYPDHSIFSLKLSRVLLLEELAAKS